VGYLSFLLRETPNTFVRRPDGMFVTAIDAKAQHRECLGEWFGQQQGRAWSDGAERDLIENVLVHARTTSRLTGGLDLAVPVTHYSVTYLYREPVGAEFIRGWHGVLTEAFYLPDVFLENTYENGDWIDFASDLEWKCTGSDRFNMEPTLANLQRKAGGRRTQQQRGHQYRLFSSAVRHVRLQLTGRERQDATRFQPLATTTNHDQPVRLYSWIFGSKNTQ
jgi:hypothetical protein